MATSRGSYNKVNTNSTDENTVVLRPMIKLILYLSYPRHIEMRNILQRLRKISKVLHRKTFAHDWNGRRPYAAH